MAFLLFTVGTLILAVALYGFPGRPTLAADRDRRGHDPLQFAAHDRALDFVQIGAMALWIVLAGFLFMREPTEALSSGRPVVAVTST